ncbi:sporulation protein YabP [Anaerolentibacter hominis]|uniref:sporulation protein YabP n=1 Tax=Anaerolentibacter hominis TaxID=3079009 RepID=UPI0031B80276
MEEKEKIRTGSHKISLSGREMCYLTGVNDVLSFDAEEVLLETIDGVLMIRGHELHVNRLSLEKGEVDVDGRVDSMTYSDGGHSKSGESFFGRLFK